MTRRGVIAACLLAVLLAVPAECAKYSPNHFLGKCLDDAWVKSVETTLGISSTERDDLLRLEQPHLHSALPTRRFAVSDPRINGKSMDKIFSKSCTSNPFQFWGVNSKVDPVTGEITSPGAAEGSLVVEYNNWASSQLATMVFAILAQEVLGYNVSFFFSSKMAEMGARMSSASQGLCTPVHANLEEWGRDFSRYSNESYKSGIQSYVGRSGLYTTKKFVNQGIDSAQSTPVFDADFYRDYARKDNLIGALDADLIMKNKDYYPPAQVACADGVMGCKDSCSRTDTCTAREANGGKCLAVALMYPTYDEGKTEAILANNKIPSYHCFLGFSGVEKYAVDMEAKGVPVMFYHFEPDPFHYINADKFRRIYLPRPLPELAILNTATFGENGYGMKTNNPVSVDFPTSTLNLYAATVLLNHHPVATLLSRLTLAEIHMSDLLKKYVDITSNGGSAIEPDDPVFSSACKWVKDNYLTWKLWLDRLPICNVFDHMNYTYDHCTDGQPREIKWKWIEPHPLDSTKPYVCDGGYTELPPDMKTSKTCEWLKANFFMWVGWIFAKPACDAQFYTFRVSACDSKSKRTAEYYWLLPDPADKSRSLECDGGVGLPDKVEIACEFAPHSSPLFTTIATIAASLVVILIGMIGFVVKYRNESIIKRSQYEFLVVMIIGGIIICGAAIVYGGEPTNFLCAARPVMISLGFTLIFGSLVIKSMRVYRVFMSGAMKRVVLSTKTMFKILGLFTLVDSVILLAWFVFDFPAPYWKETTVGVLGGATVKHHVCMSSSFIFTALLIFWKAIVLLMGLYLSFLIRNVSTDFQESIWIFASALVVLFGSVIILPMAYLVELPADVFYAFLGFMLLACTAMVMLMMLVPKVRRLHETSNDTTTRETTKTHGDRSSHGTSDESTPPSKVNKVRLGVKAQVQITPVEEFRPKSVRSDGSKKKVKKNKKKGGADQGSSSSSD